MQELRKNMNCEEIIPQGMGVRHKAEKIIVSVGAISTFHHPIRNTSNSSIR